MKQTAEQLEKRYGEGRTPDTEIRLKSLILFEEQGSLSVYGDIKNVCYGIFDAYHEGRTLVAQKNSFETLLKIVDGFHSAPKKLKRCFHALMGAYLKFEDIGPKSLYHEQAISLRNYLERWLPQLITVRPQPEWLAGALEHRNLFGADPTARYGLAVLRGEGAEFEHVCDALVIGGTSWVRRHVVISAIDAAVSQSDLKFLSYLESLIDLLRNNNGVRQEGAVKLLDRYAQQESTPENIALRSFAIETFGNPLITTNRQRWFEVSDDAREMIANWLKGFLIERFFELLSHDGRTDKRRPKFWRRYQASISNMWFILGTSAMGNWNEDFKKLRGTMGNQCIPLEGSTAANNAFVMRLGQMYIVEFGEKGNATYVFDQKSIPFDLTAKRLHLHRLKDSTHKERLLHKDGSGQWEEKFIDTLSNYGVYPDDTSDRGPARHAQGMTSASVSGGVFTPPNFRQVFKQFCNDRGLRYDDRAPSGRLVVYVDSNNPVINGKLGQWGFTYRRGLRRWEKNG